MRFSKLVVRTSGSLFHSLPCDLGQADSLSETKFLGDRLTLKAPKASFRVPRVALNRCQGKMEY